MKRRTPPTSPPPSSSSSSESRRLSACRTLTHPPRPAKRSRTPSTKPPRPPSPSLSASRPPPREATLIKNRVSELLDSYLETTLGPPPPATTPEAPPGVPYASLRAPAATDNFRLFNDSRPGAIGLHGPRETASSASSSDDDAEEEHLKRLQSVVVSAPNAGV